MDYSIRMALQAERMKTDPKSWRHSNIGRLMNNALNKFERRVLKIMAESGYDQARYAHLTLTRNLDLAGTTTSELARRAAVTKQAMGEVVEQCEKLGLVKRIPDKTDARAKIVKFTKAGMQWLRAFKVAVERAEQEMCDELGYLRVDAICAALADYGRDFDQLSNRRIQPSSKY